MDKLIVFGFLVLATSLEATGDAIIRMGLGPQALPARLGLFAVGGALLFGYGVSLNLAPIEFHRVVGMYIATLFVVWQIVNYFTFKNTPTLPILIGGALIVIGGLIVTLWESPAHT
jgi:hypothetical protein